VLLVDADTYGGAVAHANMYEHHRSCPTWRRDPPARPPSSGVSGG
jgi:hypothetical protein